MTVGLLLLPLHIPPPLATEVFPGNVQSVTTELLANSDGSRYLMQIGTYGTLLMILRTVLQTVASPVN